MLVDGSEFDWLGTWTRLLLLGAIDDATSTVLALHFRPAEDLHGYLTLRGRLAARDVGTRHPVFRRYTRSTAPSAAVVTHDGPRSSSASGRGCRV